MNVHAEATGPRPSIALDPVALFGAGEWNGCKRDMCRTVANQRCTHDNTSSDEGHVHDSGVVKLDLMTSGRRLLWLLEFQQMSSFTSATSPSIIKLCFYM